ncbi:kinase-like domain-containing protein [Desarmillaria tabescens]|uniref:non-specific serine/threonine protein kinase n=1 Tax=Armillaria tabescens TaxID=1929756 RepID=A0AA39N248_ARMTA|nr:kinase-like domain-containing protein [Desarmillaria tabescens]KAK0455401.1 kinase-like domain-containing protein [Desarmillaria tabescens]
MLQPATNTSPDASSQSLADLSRRASVISTSSSDAGQVSPVLTTPRPRPIRTFSAPRSASPLPATPRASRPPSYLTRDLAVSTETPEPRKGSRSTSRAPSKSRGPTIEDFTVGETLGEGSYSTFKVLLATYLRTGQKYAIKTLDKSYLIRKQKMATALTEKNALLRLGSGHPGLVRMHFAFQDEWSLYFVIDLATNGELQTLISRMGSLSTRCSRYYAAQIIDAIHFMHDKGVIHRDLKPENILIDEAFRIKITDFGTAKIQDSGLEAERFVGTAQFIAPELVSSNETSRSSDIWAFGCIVYQMIAGRFAFSGLSEYLTMQKVKKMEYSFPEGFDEQGKDLVQKLLVRDPQQRLGAGTEGTDNDMKALYSHPFFASINWKTLWTDPAPPLESGLIKKEHPLSQDEGKNWEDVGVAWDEIANGSKEDDTSWAAEGDVSPIVRHSAFDAEPQQMYSSAFSTPTRLSPSCPALRIHLRLLRHRQSMYRHDPRIIIHPGASPESSSDGSPVGTLVGAFRSMRPLSLGPDSLTEQRDALLEVERGRKQAMTPVQGNGPLVDLFVPSFALLSPFIDSLVLQRIALEPSPNRTGDIYFNGSSDIS